MRHRTFPLCGLAVLILLSCSALADGTQPAATAPPPPPPSPPWVLLPPPWAGSLALGYSHSGGNTRTSAFNAKLEFDYKGTTWGNTLLGSAYTGSRDQQTTDERYSLSDKVNYNLTPRDYLFTQGSYDDDRFAAIAERYALAVGYGRHLLATPRQTLDVEIGGGVNRSRDQDSRRFAQHAIATLGGKYVWKISATSQFSETLATQYASNDVYVNPITELKLAVIGNLFATVDYEVRYHSKTTAGTLHTDQITTLNLGYSFGPQ